MTLHPGQRRGGNNGSKFGPLERFSPREKGQPSTEGPGRATEGLGRATSQQQQHKVIVVPTSGGWKGHKRRTPIASTAKWLSAEYYRSNMSGFSQYDPASWMQSALRSHPCAPVARSLWACWEEPPCAAHDM